jgi:membrane-bound metal-dependent hydrolase YbcI (DUF457 family)
MASPVGHSLIGCSVYALWFVRSGTPLPPAGYSRPGLVAAFIVMANLPDIDFLLSWMASGNPNTYHFGWTHTLVFALIVSATAGPFLKLDRSRLRGVLIALTAVGSHTIADFFTGPIWGFSRTYGIPWLAPITMERVHSPLTLFVGTRHQTLDQLFSLHNILWSGYEFLLLSPVLYIIHRNAHLLNLNKE